MIRRAWTLCVLVPLAVAGAAQAHDSGPAIARALVALRQGPDLIRLFRPGLRAASRCCQPAAPSHQPHRGRNPPVDFSLSAVGAARELELHLNRPGTIITLLGGDLGATSTDIEGPLLGALVRRSQQVYNREGAVPALTVLIDSVEAARDAPADDDGGGRLGVVLVTAAALVAGSVLALFGLRRARRP